MEAVNVFSGWVAFRIVSHFHPKEPPTPILSFLALTVKEVEEDFLPGLLA